MTENVRVMKPMPRVYVAGAYSHKDTVVVFKNMRKGMRMSTELMLNYFAPFCPWLDYQFVLQLRGKEELYVEDFYEYSIEWLKASEVMFLVEGWEGSKGTIDEIKVAKENCIPIFESMEKLIKCYFYNSLNAHKAYMYLRSMPAWYWVSPTELGENAGNQFKHLGASAWGSRAVKKLVEEGWVERNHKGQYRIKIKYAEKKGEDGIK